MSDERERVIELSRTKLVMMIAGSLLFVAAGAWFLTASEEGSLVGTLGRFARPWMIHGLGAVAILFFGGCALYGAAKAFDRRPGLVLRPDGFVDNSSAVAAGFIPWREVTGLGIFEFNRQRMLVVQVAEPEKYAARGNALKRALNQANTRMCGSPVVISSNALRIPFDELHGEFASRLARHAGPRAPSATGG